MIHPRKSWSRKPAALRWRPLAAALLAAAAWGCSSSPVRPSLTEAQYVELNAASAARSNQVVASSAQAIVDRVAELDRTAPDRHRVLNVLALSGGGDWGAFGSGFLVGWGECADAEWRRPEFDSVTGVSTGALLAPFAFVGTDEACRAVDGFYRDPRKDWVRSRGLFFFLPSNPSFLTIENLERSIRQAFHADLVRQVAAEADKGKFLAVSATDIDLGRQEAWNLGAEAKAAVESGNPDRFHKILLASAAIPAAFPPVELDGKLYVDGGVTANVFLRLDPDSPNGVLQLWRRTYPNTPLPKVRYWIIINNQLNQTPATVQMKWTEVLGPSLATAIRSATLAEVRWLTAQVNFVNSFWDADIEVRVVAIPDEWRPVAKGDFLKENMESLSDLGRKMGADPKSWKVWASPRRKGEPPTETSK